MVAGATAAAGQALGNIAGDWIGQSISSHFNRKSSKKAVQNALLMMQVQDNIWRNQLRDYHQIESEGLKAAGMNPALTAYNGANPAGVGAGSLNFSPTDNGGLGNLGTEMVSGMRDTKRVENETNVADATAYNQTSQGFKNYQEAKWVDPKAKADIAESGSETARNYAFAEEAKSQINVNEQQANLLEQQTVGESFNNITRKLTADFESKPWVQKIRAFKEMASAAQALGDAASPYVKIYAMLSTAKSARIAAENLKGLGLMKDGQKLGDALQDINNTRPDILLDIIKKRGGLLGL